MNVNYTFQLHTIDITEFGYNARLYKCGDKWTVNFPQPLISATAKELEKYSLFIDYVLFCLQELNS